MGRGEEQTLRNWATAAVTCKQPEELGSWDAVPPIDRFPGYALGINDRNKKPAVRLKGCKHTRGLTWPVCIGGLDHNRDGRHTGPNVLLLAAVSPCRRVGCGEAAWKEPGDTAGDNCWGSLHQCHLQSRLCPRHTASLWEARTVLQGGGRPPSA